MSQLDDGFSTTIAFGTSTVTDLFIAEVQPPSLEGGGSIPTSLMSNSVYRTFSPKQLLTLGELNFEAAYDPAVYDEMIATINVNQLITVTFPDTTTLAFWGWLDSFVPNNNVEGERPTASCVIIPSLVNGSNVETAPVHTP